MISVEQLVERLSVLPVAIVSDCLDRLGARDRVMADSIRPVAGGNGMTGVAFPLQAVPRGPREQNLDDGAPMFNRGIEAVDQIPVGAVVVVATGGFRGAAAWGELLSMRALALGAVGAVTDGAVRDTGGIDELGYPTYAAACCARDAEGRMTILSYGEPIVCGGVAVNPGDIVRGDPDGIIVVPAALAGDVVAAGETRRSGESVVKRDLREGRSVTDVFADYGIL